MSNDETKSREELVEERDRAREDLRLIETALVGLNDANRHLHEVDRLRGQFFSSMSHELRTPLNSVIGFLEDTLDGMAGQLNPEQARYLGHALGSAEHLLTVINDVLDVAMIETGKSLLVPEPVDFAGVVASATAVMEPLIQKKGQRLTVTVPADLPLVMADPHKTLQILLNLLSNANKYTHDGGHLELAAKADGAMLRVQVRDDGIGLRPEDLATVFDEFTPVAKRAVLQRPGTGLGLSITRRLVELQGGTISVESAPGAGSTFTFTLPFA